MQKDLVQTESQMKVYIIVWGRTVLYKSSGPSHALCGWNLMVQLLPPPSPAKVAWAEKLLLITGPAFLSLPGRDLLQVL